MKKALCKRRRGILVLGVMLAVLLMSGLMFPMQAAAFGGGGGGRVDGDGNIYVPPSTDETEGTADSSEDWDEGETADSVDISTTGETWRYIHIRTSGVAVYFPDFSATGSQNHPLLKMPAAFDATVIFNFPGVTHKSKPVLVTGIVRMHKVMTGSVYNYHAVFGDDTKVNIRESYYNLFQEKSSNFSSVKMTWYTGGIGWALGNKKLARTFSFDVKFSSAPKPDGADDPNSPDFEPGDNGGLDTTPLYERAFGWWRSFYNRLTKLTGWGLSYEWFTGICIGILCLIICGIILSVIGRRR